MNDELRDAVVREQKSRGLTLLETQESQIKKVIFEKPINVNEMRSLKDSLPDKFSSVLDMLTKTQCWLSVTLEREMYQRHILGKRNLSWGGKYIEVDESRKLLDVLSKINRGIEKLSKETDLTYDAIMNPDLSQKKEDKEKEMKSLRDSLSLKVNNEYGTVILKRDNQTANAFFAIGFYPWKDNEPITRKYWPHVDARWVPGSGANHTPLNEVFEKVLEHHAHEKQGEDSWNIGRSTAQILIQIKQHLIDERAYYENPRELEKTWVRYRRIPVSFLNKDVNVMQGFDQYRLELIGKDPNEYFMREGNTFTIPKADNPTKWYRIEQFLDEEDVIVISENRPLSDDVPNEGTLIKAPDLYQNYIKTNTVLKLLSDRRPPKLKPLVTLVTQPRKLPKFEQLPIDFIDPDLKNETEENISQRNAIMMAMATPDATVIKGPPGTGKTTVICELAQQFIRRGQKVLVVAPTHVAVDNVLEKIGEKPGIYPIRWGSVKRIDDSLKGYSLSVQRGQLRKKIIDEYEEHHPNQIDVDNELARIQQQWIEELKQPKKHKHDEDVIESLLKSQANLVCSTTIGIVGRGLVKRDTIPFDVMIIDEASKSTIAEFLVPGTYARKWILVGDEKQLSPYVERDKVEEMVAIMLYDHARREEWGADWLLKPLEKENGDSAKMSDFFRVDSGLQDIIRKYANEVVWRLDNYFQLRFSDGKARTRLKNDIFMWITNLKWNLEFEKHRRIYKTRLRKWKQAVEQIKETYRKKKDLHDHICKTEDERYRKETEEYERRRQDILDYPALVEKKRAEHEKKVEKARNKFAKTKQKQQDEYTTALEQYNKALEDFKEKPGGMKKPKPPKRPETREFVVKKFVSPPKPEPLPEPKPQQYPEKPEPPQFPEKPKEPEEPDYLKDAKQEKHHLITDDDGHLWKALQTICAFEFDSGFELLLESLTGGAKKDGYHFIKDHPRIAQLEYQFRMHPDIADFNSKVVYEGMYKSAAITKNRGVTLHFHDRDLKKAILFLDTSGLNPWCLEKLEKTKGGKEKKGRYYNLAEAKVVAKMVQELERNIKKGKLRRPENKKNVWEIGVIAFYAAQARCIRKEISKHHKRRGKWSFDLADGKGRLQVSIVDRFQGKEKDIIILSFARSNPKKIQGFLKVLNRLNVATTRAREKLILVGNVSFLKEVKGKGLIPHLVNYVEKKGIVYHITRHEVGLHEQGVF